MFSWRFLCYLKWVGDVALRYIIYKLCSPFGGFHGALVSISMFFSLSGKTEASSMKLLFLLRFGGPFAL